jgi:hypothetical protein
MCEICPTWEFFPHVGAIRGVRGCESGRTVNEHRDVSAFGSPSKRRRDTQQRGRTCAEYECDTILSRYNSTDWCSVHEPTRMVPATRKSK